MTNFSKFTIPRFKSIESKLKMLMQCKLKHDNNTENDANLFTISYIWESLNTNKMLFVCISVVSLNKKEKENSKQSFQWFFDKHFTVKKDVEQSRLNC